MEIPCKVKSVVMSSEHFEVLGYHVAPALVSLCTVWVFSQFKDMISYQFVYTLAVWLETCHDSALQRQSPGTCATLSNGHKEGTLKKWSNQSNPRRKSLRGTFGCVEAALAFGQIQGSSGREWQRPTKDTPICEAINQSRCANSGHRMCRVIESSTLEGAFFFKSFVKD